MFIGVSLHLKIRFTGHYAGPNFAGFKCPDFHIRWIQLVVELFEVFFLNLLVFMRLRLCLITLWLVSNVFVANRNFDTVFLHLQVWMCAS